MDARFAGSHRLGDRRRRRLAVETDDAPTDASSAPSLPAPAGTLRALHSSPAAETHEESVPQLPLTRLIPSQWWKYLIFGIAAALVGGGLLAGAWYESTWSTLTGTGLPRLFRLPDAPVVAWYSSLLLNLSAQLSLLIWWGRSRSLKDFDGRYRLWTRTAGVCLLFSFCVATGAHLSWSETLLHFWTAPFRHAAILLWMLPAAGLGLNRLLVLNREMNDCRPSRMLLFTAAAAYVLSGTLQFDYALPISQKALSVLEAGTTLTGHLALFLSLWIHARHVLYFTADPSHAPRRRLRIPRPHFRLPKLRFGWKRAAESTSPAAEPTPESRPTRRRKARKAEETVAEAPVAEAPNPEPTPAAVEHVEPPAPRTKPRYRLDSQHRTSASPRAASHDEAPEPIAPPEAERKEDRPQKVTMARSPFVDPEPEGPAEDFEQPAPVRTESLAPPPAEETSPVETEEDWSDDSSRPDLRGMSKKQRRKILAELREKERNGRRR